MAVDPTSDARGLLALLALLLWPGLLVVRSPWTLVPFLSASFWLLSAWWMPNAWSRSSFLGAVLAFSGLLSLLRLLKPIPSWRPSPRTLLALLLALAAWLPVVWLAAAPGLSLASAEATLLSWRDGWPSSYEPLLPVPRFGAHAPGLPLLAADVSRLSGVAPARAVTLVSCSALGLCVLALETLGRRARRPTLGLASAAVALAVGLLAASVGGPAPGPSVLAAALGLAALALLAAGSGRSPAVAAGFLLGGAFTVEVAASTGMAAAALLASRDGQRRLALAVALVLGTPRLAVLLRALQPAEMRAAVLEPLARAQRPPPAPDPPARGAMAWLSAHTNPLDRVCVDPRGPGWFIPALAGRATDPPEIPAVYREEAGWAEHPSCRFVAVFGRSAPAGAPLVPAEAVAAYSEGDAAVFEVEVPGTPSHPLTSVPGTSRPPPAVESQ